MRFLVDACAGIRLAQWLTEQGHNAICSREIGPDPGDRALLKRSVEEKRILVTIDKDFGRFLFMEEAGHCGIVRLPDVITARRILLMEQVLVRHGQDLADCAVVTVRGGRIRVSRSPGSGSADS